MNENQNVEELIKLELDGALTKEEQLVASLPSNVFAPAKSSTTFEKDDMKPVIVKSIYNPVTGISTPVETEDIEPEIAEVCKEYDVDPSDLLDKLVSAGDISTQDISKIISSKFSGLSVFDVAKLTEIVQAYTKNKKIGYNDLPEYVQKQINTVIASSGITDKNSVRCMRNTFAKDFVDGVVAECISNGNGMDLDECITELKSLEEEMRNNANELEAGVRVNLITKIIDKYEEKIKEYEETDPEKAKDLDTSIVASMKESVYLTKFKEFCKTVRIKRYDLENPGRIFETFNNKYYTHKLNINDIRSCPTVLAKHIPTHIDDKGIYKICLAFCKYCLNFSPDNPSEHIFMYYFITNIYILNLIHPNGLVINTDNKASKDMDEFYFNFKSNLVECIENIK